MDSIYVSFEKCLKKHYAMGAFNFFNLESLQAILQAGEECKMPVICSISESAIQYIGLNTAVMMFETLSQNKKYPAYLHLDHGRSYEICKKAIDAGFDSVMIDGSSLSFDENVKLTKKVVNYANKQGVFVEGEIGVLAGNEDNVNNLESRYSNPEEVKKFVELTKVDSVAVAIGTSHGAYKFKYDQKLRIDILSEIEKLLPKFPIVLHGASTVDKKTIKQINIRGGKLKNAKGVDKNELMIICKDHNVCKVNVDTDIRLVFIASLRQTLRSSPKEINPRYFLSEAKESMKTIIAEKIFLFKGLKN